MKRKKKIIIIITILLLIVIGLGLFISSKKVVVNYEQNIEAMLNQELYNLDNIKNIENGKILTKKKLVDTSKIGKISVKFQVENFFKQKQNYKYTVTVLDKEAPVITFKKELEIEVGTEIDLLKDVTAEDNSNEDITVKVEGDYDINTPGDYTLYYVAEDASANAVKEEFVLHVKAKSVVITTPNSAVQNKTFTTANGFKGIVKNGVTYIDGYLIVNKTYSLPSSYGNGLTATTTDAFNKMQSAATLDGLNIYIASGFRTYNYQKNLYNKYVNRDGISAADTYSARAGHSEHQTGLAFDVNTVNSSFANTAEAKWLNDNCYKYGFILRYPKDKTRETGYQYEPWHFRYVGLDLAQKLYNNGDWITMEKYFGITSSYS